MFLDTSALEPVGETPGETAVKLMTDPGEPRPRRDASPGDKCVKSMIEDDDPCFGPGGARRIIRGGRESPEEDALRGGTPGDGGPCFRCPGNCCCTRMGGNESLEEEDALEGVAGGGFSRCCPGRRRPLALMTARGRSLVEEPVAIGRFGKSAHGFCVVQSKWIASFLGSSEIGAKDSLSSPLVDVAATWSFSAKFSPE